MLRQWAWYVSNVSIIFDAPCLFLHHLHYVLLNFVVFLCIFWNWPINEMPQCQFPIFCYFHVSEKLQRKYSQNWTKQKPNLLIFTKASRRPKRRRRGPRASHTIGWRGQPLARAPWWWGHLAHLLTLPFHLYIPPGGKNLNTRSIFRKHITILCHHWPEIGRVQKLFPAPCRRGESPPEVFFIAMLVFGVMSQ
jgi:hypothetical protein